MVKPTVVILNGYKKTKGPGISVKSQPLVHTFDHKKMGKGPAAAIRDVVERAIKSISEEASAGTISKRRRAGRMGRQLFNDTGKLARALFVAEKGEAFETRAPADRLRDLPADVLARLFDVAAIKPKDLVKDKAVRAAIKASARSIIVKKRR